LSTRLSRTPQATIL